MARSVLLDALSSFWHRAFADLGKVEPLLEGAELVLADAYTNMLASIAAQDIRKAPLPRFQRPRLVTLREQDAILETDGRLSFPIEEEYADIQFLQTSPLQAQKNLSRRFGGFVLAGGRVGLRESWLADAEVPKYVASVPVGATVTITTTLPVRYKAGDTLLLRYPGSRTQTLTAVGESRLNAERRVGTAVGVRPIKTGTATLIVGAEEYTVTVQNVDTMDFQAWGLWAQDSLYDGFEMYRSFGHMLGDKRPSTAQYREYIRGVMQLQILGPALGRLEAGLCAVAGLPVVQTEGEVVARVTGRTIVTSAETYEIPAPYNVLPHVTAGAVLPAFSVLCDAIKVLDEVSSPGWWHGRTVPSKLLPDVPYLARVATKMPFPTNLGVAARWYIGDPAMTIGKTYSHTTAFVLMDEIISKNMFTVQLHPALQADLPLFLELQQLAVENRPSHTFAYVIPFTEFTDTATLSDETLVVKSVLFLSDIMDVQDQWKIGDEVDIGPYYSIDASGEYAYTGDDLLPVVIGGGVPADPSAPEAGFTGVYGDGAVYVRNVTPVYASPLYTFAQPTGASVTGGSGPTDAP